MATTSSDSKLPFWLTPPALAVFVAILLVVRFQVAAQTGLVRDEGYYAFWSMLPAAGYLDHPPMIAWLIGFGRGLLGESEAGVRLFPVLTTAVISFAIYRTGRALLDGRTAGIAVIWYNLTVAGGLLFVAVPDAPAVMFWTLSLWAVAEFVGSRNANWWLAAGLFAGLGLLSKYTTGFLGVGLLLFVLSSRERRSWLGLWQVWAGGVVAVLVFLPNLMWNAERGWLGFAYQARRMDSFGLNFGSMLDNLYDLLLGQVLASGILLFLFAAIGLVMFFGRIERPGREGLALPIFASLPILLYFIAYTARFRAEANWLLPVWPMFALVGAWAAVHLRPVNVFAGVPLAIARWIQAPLGLMLLAFIYGQALYQPFELTQAIDRTRDMRGWRQMQLEVATLAAANGAQWVAVASDYGLTGELATYNRFSGTTLPVRPVNEPERWAFLPAMDPSFADTPALFVKRARGSRVSPEQFFANAELVGEARRMQGEEEELERFEVYLVSQPNAETRAMLLGE